MLIVGIIQSLEELSDSELSSFQSSCIGFKSYILDIGEPSNFEMRLIGAGSEIVLFEGMVNGVFGKFLDQFPLKNGYNRVQAPYMQTIDCDNVVYRYRESLQETFQREFALETEVLYDDFILDVLKRCSQEEGIFTRELDVNGRFVQFSDSRRRKETDFNDFCEYLDLVRENCGENRNRLFDKNFPQLDLRVMNLLVLISQLRNGNNVGYFLGGPISNSYMPKQFESMLDLYSENIVPNCEFLLPEFSTFKLFDMSIGRMEENE